MCNLTPIPLSLLKNFTNKNLQFPLETIRRLNISLPKGLIYSEIL